MPADPMLVVCPACTTFNRIPAAKLGDGGRCGKCSSPLFRGEPLVLTCQNFEAHAGRSDVPLVVDFWASWCAPCRQMAPAFAAAAPQLEPRVRLGKLDTQSEPAIAARFAVRSLPTLVLVSEGKEIARQPGAMPTTSILAWVRPRLAA